MKDLLKKSVMLSLVMLLLCGVLYPLVITGLSQILFNKQANGSLVTFNGKTVGSKLIGQSFSDPRFFMSRSSSVAYNIYDESKENNFKGPISGGSNLAPSSKTLTDRVQKDLDAFLKANPTVKRSDIPQDILTSSGSGLDPDISPQAAKVQVPAVAKASGISEAKLNDLVKKYTVGRTLGIFGEARVNVLMLNLEVAKLLKEKGSL